MSEQAYRDIHTFSASKLTGRMAWSYHAVCAIGSLSVSNRTKRCLIAVFRLWGGDGGELELSDFATNNLIQSNGRLMPFFRFAARYEMNREKWRIRGLGQRGEMQLIKEFAKNK